MTYYHITSLTAPIPGLDGLTLADVFAQHDLHVRTNGVEGRLAQDALGDDMDYDHALEDIYYGGVEEDERGDDYPCWFDCVNYELRAILDSTEETNRALDKIASLIGLPAEGAQHA